MPFSLHCSSLTSVDFATEQFATPPGVFHFDAMLQALVLRSVVLHAGLDHLARERDGRREKFDTVAHNRYSEVLCGTGGVERLILC